MTSKSSAARTTWRVAGVLVLAAVVAGAFAYTRQEEEVTAEKAKATEEKVVRVARAQRKTIPLASEYRGELIAEAAEIAAQGSGRLLEVTKALGDSVKKGELLAVVDASESKRLFGEARAQLQSAKASQRRIEAELETAKVELDRAKRLQAERVASEQEVSNLRSQVKVLEAELQAAEASRAAAAARVSLYRNQIDQARLTAPFDGAVATRHLDPGSSVSPGTPILRLIKDEPLRVRFRVSEQHLNRLSVDSPFTVTTLATKDEKFPGHVERIGAEVSRTDRSVAAEGVLDESSDALKPGMYAVVDVELGRLKDAVTVPSEAVLTKTNTRGAPERGVKIVENGKAQYVRVDVLGQHRELTAVKGLEPNTTVITFGQESVSDGAKVRAVDTSGQ